MCAFLHGHLKILKWFKSLNLKFKYSRHILNGCDCLCYSSISHCFKTFYFWVENINIKKIIKWSYPLFKKLLKFKTKNNYIKGYNKN